VREQEDPRGSPGPPAGGQSVGGGYTVVAEVSRGAMGSVYRARDPDGKEVALKRLIDVAQSARFEIEARLLLQLSHPRVVKVLDHFQDETGQYVVMELVTGTDLAYILGERGDPGLPVEEAVRYTLEACEALRYVHAEHIVHRDVKPANLIAGADGVVLVDFGIARELEDIATGTGSGTRAIGTPQYMAPEVLVGEAVSPRSDVYSTAATLWTLLLGKPPMYHDSTPLAASVPGVSEELEHSIRAGLELQPERRLASIDALARALGSPLARPAGQSLARSVAGPAAETSLLEAIVRTAAGVFDAAAASIALVDPATEELVYQAAWGAGGNEIVGVRLPPGMGLAAAAVSSGEGLAVPDCRTDPRFAAQIAQGTNYVPHTMLAAPLMHDERAIGVLSLLDKRDGEPYRVDELERAHLFTELAVEMLSAVGSLSGGAVS
jgi:tRNA A-37 threonylcarbamoyl transferase component Bud32